MDNKISEIIDKYEGKKEALIQIMQDINSEYNYLPMDKLKYLSEKLTVPLSEIYGIATFYKTFSLKPRGKHLVNVCMGTACHVKGGENILQKFERDLNVKAGETTQDLNFTLKTVRCLGCCSLSPVARIDKDIYGRLTQAKISKTLKKYTEVGE